MQPRDVSSTAAYVHPPLALGVQSLPDPFDEERLGADPAAVALLESSLAEGDILSLRVHAIDLELPVAPAFPMNGSVILIAAKEWLSCKRATLSLAKEQPAQ